MRILHLAFFTPLPLHNGSQIREYSLIQPLIEGNEVDLIAFQDSIDSDSITELNKMYSSVALLELPKPDRGTWWKEIFRGLRHVFSTQPPVSVDHFSLEMKNIVLKAMRNNAYDLVYVDLLWMLEYISPDSVKNTPVVLSTHNVEHQALLSFANRPIKSTKDFVARWYFKLSAQKMKLYETHLLTKADTILAVSQRDKAVLKQISNSKVVVMPNAVHVPPYSRTKNSVTPNSIVFVGSMYYKPNIEAVDWFSRNVLPLIRQKVSDVTFTIVGANPTQEVLKLRNDHVIVTGTVTEISPFLNQAACFVAPLFSGGGTNVKVIEAMANGIPVVSTSKGIEGLTAIPDLHVLKADTSEEFAEAVIKIFQNQEDFEHMGKKARELVINEYSWQKVQKDMRSFIDSISTYE